MTTLHKNTGRMFSAVLCAAIIFTGCTKFEKDDDFPKGDPPVIDQYTNSDQIAPADLVAHFAFEGNLNDAKGGITGGAFQGRGAGYTAGKKGQGYQSGDSSWIAFANAGPLANLTSFSVSFWVNSVTHPDGAHGVFMVTRNDGSFWGNFFFLIESTRGANVVLKTHLEKNVTPPVANSEHWIEPSVATSSIFNGWRHVTITYDETTSRFAWYLSGNPITLPPGKDKLLANTPNNTPLGPLKFKDAARFVIGAFQNQLGRPYNTPEPWMVPYVGKLDEFKVFKRALTANEANALFQLEKQGR